jgi:D-amino peptidase
MRVLIMSDMEGVSGIVVWEQVNGGAPMYEEGRRLYTEEINAAVRGAKRAGATENRRRRLPRRRPVLEL